MSEVEITTTSIKGQVVIPQSIRDELNIQPGTKFAAFGKKDIVILKKMSTPSIQDFENLVDYGTRFAREKGIKSEKDVQRILRDSGKNK